MTSRSLFFNLLKEDFRRRLWAFILASLVFFGTFGVAFTMLVQNWADNYRSNMYLTEAEMTEQIAARVTDFIGFNPWLAIVACVGAVICGVSGFAFLHSKKQVDFFHSLPVKREFIFAVRFVTGLLIYAIPYLIGLLFAYVITAIFGGMTGDVLWAGTVGFFFHLMGFTLMYLVTILAMLLTGKLLIAFFGIAVLSAYVPLMFGFVEALKEVFFVTQYIDSMDIEDIFLATRWFSPISFYVSLFAINTMVDFWLNVLTFLVMAAALSALCIWLYKKRMSETCGISMSFAITEPVVRMLIAVPVGVLAGFLVFTIQYDYGNRTSALLWLVFGCLLGAFLAHGIIESFYKGDVKKALSHKKQMLAAMVLSVLIPLAFYFDIFGYDSYLPEKEDIKYMAVASRDMRFGNSGYRDENGNWLSPTEYALEEMTITELEAVYELAERLSENVREHRTDQFFGYNTVSAEVYYEDGSTSVRTTEFVLKYVLKDGTEVYKTYEYNYYAVLDLIEQIYNDVEFRMSTHPIFSLEKTGWEPKKIMYYSPTLETTWGFTGGVEEIMEVYRDEVLALTFRELQETAAVAHIDVTYEIDHGDVYADTQDTVTMLIYPSMTRTLELLKAHGCDITPLTESRVHAISISYYSDVVYDYIVASMDSWDGFSTSASYEKYGIQIAGGNEIMITLTDYDEIQECLKYLVARDYCSEYGPYPVTESNYNVIVEFTTSMYNIEDGVIPVLENNYYGKTFRFKEGQVPEFLLERIEKAEQELSDETK